MLDTPQTIAKAAAELIGSGDVLTGDAMVPFLDEPRDLYHVPAAAVATPRSVEAVQTLVAWANDNGVKIVPQGGNTGLVGGQVPDREGEIILSLKHLRAVRAVDADAGVMTLEAGLTVFEAQGIAEEHGMLFPLSLGSEGSCQIGGVLSTNAGGVNVLAYGNTRDFCLGLEAVLADGRLYQGLSPLRKDNTGYSLRNLLIGGEGTLGIITAASFRLQPRPALFETALVNVADPAAGVRLFDHLRAAGGNRLTSIELLPRYAIELQLKHNLIERDPAASESPWYVLCEFSLFGADAPGALNEALEGALAKGLIADAAIAESEAHRALMWKMREAMSECQTREAASTKHDVSVPVTSIPALIDDAIAAVLAKVPGIRPFAFGHMGDGNIHFDFLQPLDMDEATFRDHEHVIHEEVYAVVARLGGSVSAEHGIGQMKVDLLEQVKDPVALSMMRAIKQALDPNNTLNPGKVLKG